MADKIWNNREYGLLDGAGKIWALDYGGSEEYFAPVYAALIVNEDGIVLGKRDSPFFITGDVQLRDEAGNILGDRDSPVFITGDTHLRDEAGNILGGEDSPINITGDITIRDEEGYFLGSGDHPMFVTGNVGDAWEVASVVEETLGDNDKSLTVPTNSEWELLSAYLIVLTDANAGNRNLAMQVLDEDTDIVAEIVVGSVQTASTTGYYQFGPSLADLVAFRDSDYLMTPIPSTIFLNETEQLRFFDRNNVAVGDSVIVRARVARRQKDYFSG